MTSPRITEEHKKITRAVLENLKNFNQLNKQLIQKNLITFDRNAYQSMQRIREDPLIKEYFDQYMLEFYAWSSSFPKALEKLGLQDKFRGYNINEHLIQIQQKIKGKIPKNSYFIQILQLVKKKLMLGDDFIMKWKQQREILRNQKISQTQALMQQKNKVQVKQKSVDNPASITKIEPEQKIKKQQESKQKEKKISQVQKQKQKIVIESKAVRVQKLKKANQLKFHKNKQIRFTNLIKYLESRKQFSFGNNKQYVAKQIMATLERFMKNKIEKIIQATKLRQPGYPYEDAGDQFRLYSSKGNMFEPKHSAMLPESDIKLLKVRYPSKLENYLKLRIEEEKQEQAIKSQFRKRAQLDKKTQRLIQGYVLGDQKEGGIHQFEQDEGPKKRARIIIPFQAIQYVLEKDPWFNDLSIMEKSFYRGPM